LAYNLSIFEEEGIGKAGNDISIIFFYFFPEHVNTNFMLLATNKWQISICECCCKKEESVIGIAEGKAKLLLFFYWDYCSTTLCSEYYRGNSTPCLFSCLDIIVKGQLLLLHCRTQK